MTANGDRRPALNRRQVLVGGSLLAAGAATGLTGCAAQSTDREPVPSAPAPPSFRPRKQPNIVYIMLDDAGWGDLEPRHSPMIDTPRMDQVAREGMNFTQMYAGSSVCSPSRAALLTGRYPTRVGIQEVLGPKQRKGLSGYEKTLPEQLRKAGYRTGIFGKWHLGKLPRHNPVRHGFDEYIGVLHSTDQNPVRLYDGKHVAQANVDQSNLTRRFTNEAIRFIKRNRRRPFFCYVPYTAPHIPLNPEPSFAGGSKAGRYGDVVQNTDFHIGRLLDKLDELGLRENTIVIVTSDNGPWFEGSTGGLRGGKTNSYEGGVRSAFFLRWPSEVQAGSTCDKPASFLDMLPTLVGIGGGDVPTDRPIDGLDISSALKGGPMPHREALYYFKRWKLNAVRSGPWKLHLPSPNVKHRKQLRLLFNIDEDPGERYDQAANNPEQLRRLQKLANRFAKEIAEQRPKAIRRSFRR